MNQKQLLILVVVMAVLGGAALMLLKRDADSRQVGAGEGGSKLLADLPVGEELATIRLQTDTNTLTLSKQDGVWVVAERDGYPANYAEISRTVLRLRDLEATQTETVTESQLARLQLLEPGSAEGSGTLIEFRDGADQRLAALLVGKEQTRTETAPSQFGGGGPREVPVGRWVRNPENQTQVALVSETLSNMKTTPGSWLSKDFFKVEKIKSIEVNYPDAVTNSFAVTRETENGSWTLGGLEDDEELDTTKTSSFNYALSSPSFTDVITEVDEGAIGLADPTRITIETFDGFRYDVKAGTKTNSEIAMRVSVSANYPRERTPEEGEDESAKAQADKEFADKLTQRDEKLEKEQALGKWTYLVSSWTLDSLLKKRPDLVKEKEPVAEEASDNLEVDEPSEIADELLDLPPTE